MNPVIQEVNERNVSGRDTLIITTSIIKDPTIHHKMVEGIGLIKNIVIASPLISELPEVLLKEIRENYGVSIRGRYADLGLPSLTTARFETHWDFANGTARLNGTALVSHSVL
jgi:hypothetical protein